MTSRPSPTIPSQLLSYDHWVCWREQHRGEKPTKVPINPETGQYASTTDSNTWASFETAQTCAEDGSFDGVGYVFTTDDPFVGVDLDDARDPETEEPAEWAETVIEQLNSFTEVSPSGTGYHILVEGELPPGRNRRGNVELYEEARFFTVTGEHVEGTPESIQDRHDALYDVYKTHVGEETEPETDAESDEETNAPELPSDHETTTSTNTLSNTELLERARAASNGAKFERLWRGDTRGYESHSEADMALSCLLAFWTGGDVQQMDTLFRRSGLMREKWDVVHYGDGSTYGETTLTRAAALTSDHYTPTPTGESNSNAETDRSSYQPASAESPPASTPTDIQEDSVAARERARIETITTLEKRLRELEAENERLRNERDVERSKRQALKTDAEVNIEPWIPRFVAHLRRLLPRRSS